MQILEIHSRIRLHQFFDIFKIILFCKINILRNVKRKYMSSVKVNVFKDELKGESLHAKSQSLIE